MHRPRSHRHEVLCAVAGLLDGEGINGLADLLNPHIGL